LIEDCESSEEFEARLSDLADALDRIQVDAELLPNDKTDVQGGLNQFREVLFSLDGIDIEVVGSSIQVLQRIRGLRHTLQHSGAAHDRPKILRDLGVPDSGLSWSDTLSMIRAKLVEALLGLRTEIRRATATLD
jgi:hypothetical protein